MRYHIQEMTEGGDWVGENALFDENGRLVFANPNFFNFGVFQVFTNFNINYGCTERLVLKFWEDTGWDVSNVYQQSALPGIDRLRDYAYTDLVVWQDNHRYVSVFDIEGNEKLGLYCYDMHIPTWGGFLVELSDKNGDKKYSWYDYNGKLVIDRVSRERMDFLYSVLS